MQLIGRLLGFLFLSLAKLRTASVAHYWARRFSVCGRHVKISDGFACYGPEYVRIHAGVTIGRGVTIRAMREYPWSDPPQAFDPELEIKKGCFISNYTHISCAKRLTVGENVMIADHCFIADNNHGYEDPERSIKEQPLAIGDGLTIGEGTWIGAHACIAGSFSIGRNCVIGANAVVTSNMPDHSVAVGVPARIIKRYDHAQRLWIRVAPRHSM